MQRMHKSGRSRSSVAADPVRPINLCHLMRIAVFHRRQKQYGKKLPIRQSGLNFFRERSNALFGRRASHQREQPIRLRPENDILRIDPRIRRCRVTQARKKTQVSRAYTGEDRGGPGDELAATEALHL